MSEATSGNKPHTDPGCRFAHPGYKTSREFRFHRPQPSSSIRAVAGLEPHRLDEAARQHDLPGLQSLASVGEMVGEPGQRVVGMAEHVGAGAAPASSPLIKARPFTVSRSGASLRGTASPSTQPAAKKSSATSVGAPIVSHLT